MAWGTDPVYAHVGLDLTGPNGGQVRIESITVEDVTSVFHRSLMDWVDVRDYGAIGDGTTDGLEIRDGTCTVLRTTPTRVYLP